MEEIINILNNGDEEQIDSLRQYFSDDLNVLFKLLHKRNLIDRIEFTDENISFFGKEFIDFYVDIDKTKLYPIITHLFDDIKFNDNTPVVEIWNLSNFISLLFSERRNCASNEFIFQVIAGDGIEDYLYNDEDVYYSIRYVIEELNPDNLIFLKKTIIDKFKNIEIVPETDLLESITQDTGKSFVILDEQNIDDIIGDKDTLNYLIDEYNYDFWYNIRMLYDTSYFDSLYDEIYKDIIDELGEYFTNIKHNERRGMFYYSFDVVDFWYWVKNFTSSDIQYYSYYIDCLSNTIDNHICVDVPDYPDSRVLDKMINDHIREYL
jgi:hypothetical protein